MTGSMRAAASALVLAGMTGAAVAAALLPTCAAASADPADDALAALRAGSVYVDPGAQRLAVTVGRLPVSGALRLAVLPGDGTTAIRVATRIETALAPTDPGLVIGVVTVAPDRQMTFRAQSSAYCPGTADRAAQDSLAAHAAEVAARPDLTATITDFLGRLDAAGPRGDCAASDDGSGPGVSTVAVVAIAVVAVVAAGLGVRLVGVAGRRRRDASGDGPGAAHWGFADSDDGRRDRGPDVASDGGSDGGGGGGSDGG